MPKDDGSITGRFRRGSLTTPFGKIPLTRLAVWGLSAAVVIAGIAWALRGFALPLYTDWQLAKKPDHVLVDVELHVTRTEMAHHLFDDPEWEFSPPGWPTLRIKGFSDAICYRWEGEWATAESCVPHPDKSSKPPQGDVPPTAFAGQGASLAAPFEWLLRLAMGGGQECRSCGPYRDQFQHPGEFRYWACGQDGEWVRWCHQWADGCAGWRWRNQQTGAWETCFHWELCYHR